LQPGDDSIDDQHAQSAATKEERPHRQPPAYLEFNMPVVKRRWMTAPAAQNGEM
jgi:hypothetical protein